jgi:ubiquinone/menaquinone biosynthesis C-methylase UbiE
MDTIAEEKQLNRLLMAYWISQAIYVAAKLGIADLLKDGPRTAEQLAEDTGAHAPSLYRLLRALASEGIFAEQDGGRFTLTPTAELLRGDVPRSKRYWAIMMGEEHYQAWGDLIYSIETGKGGFQNTYRMPVFEYLSKNPDKGKIFDAAMTGIHGHETQMMIDAYDFSGIGTLADIGGGNGTVLIGVLKKYPAMKGILFDMPGVIERAQANIQAASLADRCQLVTGDFFQSVPRGADAYLMRHIIHDWDDQRCLTILRNCRAAMPNDGRVLVVESIIPPGNAPFFGKWLDLTMLVIPEGKERTEAEYHSLLSAANLKITRIVPSGTEISVIEAAPVG